MKFFAPADFICDDDKEDCIAPDLHEGETFWVMQRKDHKDFLFIGKIQIYGYQIRITQVVQFS